MIDSNSVSVVYDLGQTFQNLSKPVFANGCDRRISNGPLNRRPLTLHAVLVPQLFVEVPDIQVVIRFLVESQHLLDRRQWNALGARFSLAPIRQPGVAVLLQFLPPSAHRSTRSAYDV